MQDGFNKEEYMSPSEGALLVNEEDSDEDDINDDSLFSITSFGSDLSLRELSMMLDDRDLVVPKIQRNFVWNKKVASRFIETILFGLPVPSIFLSSCTDGSYLIVDGLQRLTTINAFINGKYPDKTGFKLSSSINPMWANKTFAQLDDEDQRRFKTTTLHAIIFKQNEPKNNDTSLYQIFERINTGGVRLSAQEIRNSIYQNYINDTLINLNNFAPWRKIFGSEKLHSRMRDVEYVLRFLWEFVVNENMDIEEHNGSINVKTELNLFMDLNSSKYKHNEEHILELKTLFEKTMTYLDSLSNEMSENIFSMPGKKVLDPILFDSIGISVAEFIKKNNTAPNLSSKEFQEKKQRFINSDCFKEITQNTRRPTYETFKARSAVAYKAFFEDA